MNSYTIPRKEKIEYIEKLSPSWAQPNSNPHAVVSEGFFDGALCDAITERMEKSAPYNFHGCNATTRELTHPLPAALYPLVDYAMLVNSRHWRFELDKATAWLQTYGPNDFYQIHSDAMIGTSRKLTTVLLLSEPADYGGGELRVIPHPEYEVIPKTRGTLVTFPAWLLHEVLPVTWGTRKTLNLGMYGPPFK